MQALITYKPDLPLFTVAPEPALQIAVIVPVKNEEEGLEKTLDALRGQFDHNGHALQASVYEVLLLANNCTDNTFLIAKRYQERYPAFHLHIAEIEIPKADAHIGTVRRIMMDEAYERFLSIGRPLGIIVSTDGDSEVDSQWIHYILLEMAKGNDVVGGRIIPRNTPDLSKMHHLRDVSYRYHLSRLEAVLDPCITDPWPRHFQCYGPSLAVTCDIYHRAGRIPAIPFLEDEEFRKALCRIDARIRKSPLVKVYTSARLAGKVDFGFSVQLRQWGEMTRENQQQQVEPLMSLIRKTTLKTELRKLWKECRNFYVDDIKIDELSRELLVERSWLMQELNSAEYFGALWESVEAALAHGEWRKRHALAPISEVISHFRQYFSGSKKLAS